MLIKCQVSTPVGQDYWKCCGALGGCWRIDTLLTVSGTKSPPSKIFERIRIDEWARSMTLPDVPRGMLLHVNWRNSADQRTWGRSLYTRVFHVEHSAPTSSD